MFYEAGFPPFEIERLAQVAPEQYAELRFELHPACRLLRSTYPLRRIWQVSQPDYEGEQAVALDSGSDHLLLRRDGFDPVVESVTAAEFALLDTLRGGDSLASACLAAQSHLLDFDVSACLQRRIGDATLVDFAVRFEQSMSAA